MHLRERYGELTQPCFVIKDIAFSDFICSLFTTFGAQRGAFEYLGPVVHLIKYIKLS